MVETAIYVLLGALTTALLALLALPAVSRRAYRLAQGRARLTAPLSAAEALAERDALRGRHAVEITLAERRADDAQMKWARAQIALGERAAEIVRRDADIADKAQEIARQRSELANLSRELAARETEIGARETALRDFEGQRDVAASRLSQTLAELKQTKTEAERDYARLEDRIEELSRELSLARHRSDSALFAAKATIADFERRLEESEAAALRLRREALDLKEKLAEPVAARAADEPGLAERRPLPLPAAPGDPGERREAIAPLHDQLADAAEREHGFAARLAALAASLSESEAATRAARADRDAAERDAGQWRENAAASQDRAERLSQADDALRQAIARLGRELVAAHAAPARADSQREAAS